MAKYQRSDANDVEYAPYVQDAHSRLLDWAGVSWPLVSAYQVFNMTLGRSPFKDAELPNPDVIYLGNNPISSYPACYEMFGKLMAGLDIETLWSQWYKQVYNLPLDSELIHEYTAKETDKFCRTKLAPYNAQMREINAINTSCYVVGKAVLFKDFENKISNFGAELAVSHISYAHDLYKNQLLWNYEVVYRMREVTRQYMVARIGSAEGDDGYDEKDLLFKVNDVLWDIKLFDDVRAMIAGPGRSSGMQMDIMTESQHRANEAAMGATIGSSYFGPVGAILGYAAAYIDFYIRTDVFGLNWDPLNPF